MKIYVKIDDDNIIIGMLEMSDNMDVSNVEADESMKRVSSNDVSQIGTVYIGGV